MAPFGDVAPALDVCRAAAGGAPRDVVGALALDALLGLVPADGAVWAEVDGAGAVTVVARPEAAEDALLAGYAEHVAGHPTVGPEGTEPAAHLIAGGHQICLFLPAGAGRRAGMALHRSTSFLPVERDRVDMIVPLVACAVLAATRAPMARSGLLTAREAAVLRSVATGMSDKQAARALGVSPRTVGKHLEHIYAKLGVAGRTEAAVQVWQQG
ncbi:MAG TPA: helix-turn-helix transcriptional regulator [Iamia sp.]|nr:helix-turn-helix transcriptional regulator [Iamia sp.]